MFDTKKIFPFFLDIILFIQIEFFNQKKQTNSCMCGIKEDIF